MTDIVILGGARTAIGAFGGSLAGTSPIELGTIVSKAALARAGVEGAQVGHVAFGHVINTEPKEPTFHDGRHPHQTSKKRTKPSSQSV